MNPTMSSIEVILLQDLAKQAEPRPEDLDALKRLEGKGYSCRRACDDWMITDEGRRALADWQDRQTDPARPLENKSRTGGRSGAEVRPQGGLWPTEVRAGPAGRFSAVSGRSGLPSGTR